MNLLISAGKILMLIIGIIAGIIVFLIVAAAIYHQLQLNKEKALYPPPGKMVEVNSNKLHVFVEGQGNETLVFMSGHGTPCPTIDFKPLWQRLSSNYRVVVIEKAGYGWSEVSGSPRDIEVILEETRQALDLAGEEGTYILVPHSMSGLEAIYWARKYPSEVKAIIGLDPTVPEFVEQALELPPQSQLNFIYFISRIGLSRFMPEADKKETLPILKIDELTKEDKEAYLAIFYRSAYTKNMLAEVADLEDNAQKVKAEGAPVDIPLYFFISDGSEVEGENWRAIITDYLQPLEMGRYKYLDSGHYMHHEKSDLIAAEIVNFISQIQ